MTTVSGKRANKNVKSTDMIDVDREFSKIKEGIKHNKTKIVEFLRQRVGPGDWNLTETDVKLDDENGSIDMIFSTQDGKKEKYILVDVSVPHLGVGQKYVLPTQAKIFQKQRNVPATRIKKAIILVRKGTETISVQALKVRCPIIEIQIENILKQSSSSSKALERGKTAVESKEAKQIKKSFGYESQDDTNNQNDDQFVEKSLKQNEEKPKKSFSSLSEDLLYALKEAIVHESLSTTYKRNNKYIRRGLWHWIEREIMDPNVHFFLIILSSIYQSKTGEILSKKFRTIDSYITNPENVINAIFSRENTLADEIKKNSERHKRALSKFLSCFSQMPPFEYLKSTFLKEFRSNSDGLKSRMAVFKSLETLLARCGFEGEKEINYPLEILDELKIFQGIICGNYETLRIDNASKKLKHLVPQIDWEADDIYSLRDQLAKVLNLPGIEFNLNAYLPQAFLQDAKNMAETRKQSLKQSFSQENRNIQPDIKAENPKETPDEPTAKLTRSERMAIQKQAKLERQAAKRKYDDEYMPKKHHQQDNIDMPMLSENGDFLSEEALAERSDRDRLILQEMGDDEVKMILDNPYAFTKPTSLKKINLEEEQDQDQEEDSSEDDNSRPSMIDREITRERRRSRYADVDESRHRHFENFGGIEEEDPDVIKLSLALAKHGEASQNDSEEEGTENSQYNNEEVNDQNDDSIYEEAPTKSMIMQGFKPSHNNAGVLRNENQHRQNNYHRSMSDNRNENRNNSSHTNRNRNSNRQNRNHGNSNGGFRDSKRYYSQRNNGSNTGYRRRSSRRD